MLKNPRMSLNKHKGWYEHVAIYIPEEACTENLPFLQEYHIFIQNINFTDHKVTSIHYCQYQSIALVTLSHMNWFTFRASYTVKLTWNCLCPISSCSEEETTSQTITLCHNLDIVQNNGRSHRTLTVRTTDETSERRKGIWTKENQSYTEWREMNTKQTFSIIWHTI